MSLTSLIRNLNWANIDFLCSEGLNWRETLHTWTYWLYIIQWFYMWTGIIITLKGHVNMYFSINRYLYLVMNPAELCKTLIHTNQYNFVFWCHLEVHIFTYMWTGIIITLKGHVNMYFSINLYLYLVMNPAELCKH